MKGKNWGRGGHRPSLPFTAVMVFAVAVLLPSAVLGLLALRAADREAAFVERSLEAALLAEVNLAAQKITALLDGMGRELQGRAQKITGPGDLEKAGELPAPAALPFFVEGDQVFTPGGPLKARADFLRVFGAFLEGREEAPGYDSVAGVYRKEMGEIAVLPAPRRKPVDGAGTSFRGEASVDREEDPDMGDFSPLAGSPDSAPAPLPEPEKKAAPPRSLEMQMVKTKAVSDPAFQDRLFRKAEEEGFSLLQRNVAPRVGSPAPGEEERSATVSRGVFFPRLIMTSEGGFLPKVTESGLELIYWTRSGGGAGGFFIEMEALRDAIAGAAPDMLTDVRLLAILDDRSEPLADPPLPPGADWRRPYVAREISPVLPGWEAGAWLTDPGVAASRARLASLVVWVLTGVLMTVIITGGVAVIRLVSSEMRLAAKKTSFVANVSHELKTPLTSIRLFAEMLHSGRQKDEARQKEYLAIMVSETERLSRLVDDVLAFSRRDRGNRPLAMAPLDLAEAAGEAFYRMKPRLAGKGFTLAFSSEGALPVLGNVEALGQVIVNLLSNSEKYSPGVKDISVVCFREGPMAAVRVEDRGSGIDPALGERIFQEFFRADDSLTAPVGGAGLGLAIARNIAREHDGDVKFRPRRGGGSVFTLYVPLAAGGEKEVFR